MRFRKYKKVLSEFGKSVYVSAEWKEQNKEVLLSSIRRTSEWKQPKKKLSFVLSLNLFATHNVFKPVMVSVLIAAMSLYGSVLTVQSAEASLPGDRLYPVKLSFEDVKVSLVFSEEKKAELEMEFAGNRLKEVREIIKKDDVDQENIKTAIEEFSNGIGSVQKRLEKIENSTKPEEKVLEISKLVNEKTDELEENLLSIKEKISEASEAPSISELDNLSEEQNSVSGEDGVGVTSQTLEIAMSASVSSSSLPQNSNPDTNSNQNQINETAQGPGMETTGEFALDSQPKSSTENNPQSNETSKKDVLSSLEGALKKVDAANTKSLEVFVKQATTSNDEELKKSAVEKVQKKIDKMEIEITKKDEENKKQVTSQSAPGSTALASTTQQILPSPSASSTMGQAGSAQTQQNIQYTQASEQAKQTIVEVKKLLIEEQAGALDKAIEAVKQVKEIINGDMSSAGAAQGGANLLETGENSEQKSSFVPSKENDNLG